jgi:hypothetical protein
LCEISHSNNSQNGFFIYIPRLQYINKMALSRNLLLLEGKIFKEYLSRVLGL